MSPEQATGDRAIDGRTDIYSLAAVLYEMLAGEPPHSGTSAQAIIAKLMTTEPQPVQRLRPSVPPNVAMAVEQALAKLPADRFGSAKAFADALTDVRFTTSLRSVSSVSPALQRRLGVEMALGAIAIVSVLTAGWALTRPAPVTSAARYNIDLDSSEAITPTGRWGRVAVSPDGSTIVYVGGPKNALMVRRRDELHAKQIPGTEQAGAPFFSPDGKHVGFFQQAAKLMTVGFDGNPPVFVTDSLVGLAGATWGSDDMIYADGVGPRSLVRVAARAGAKPQSFIVLDTLAGERDQLLPTALPDDKSILFTSELRPRDGNPIHHAIEIADRSSGEHHVLIDHATLARYAAPGYLVYVTTTRAAMAVPFDLGARKITGSPVLLAEDLSTAFSALDLAVSQTGTLLYIAGGRTAGGRDLVWVSRNGKAVPVDSSWHGSFSDPAISPDGKWLVVTSGVSLPDVSTAQASNVFAAAGAGDIWVRRLADGVITKLTVDAGTNRFPAWSGDSKFVLFAGGVNSQTVVEKQVDGGTPPVSRTEAEQYLGAVVESPDRQWLVYQQGIGVGNAHLFARRRGDNAAVSLFKGVAVTRVRRSRPTEMARIRLERERHERYSSPS
jgi:serine/threonine-protein kinase